MQPKWQFDYYFWLEEVFFSSRLYILCRLDLKGNLVFTPFQDEHSQLFHEPFLVIVPKELMIFFGGKFIRSKLSLWYGPSNFTPRAPIEAFDKVFKSTKEKCFAILFLRILQSLSESPRSRQSIPWVGFSAPTQTTFPPPLTTSQPPDWKRKQVFIPHIIISPPKVHIHAIINFSTINFLLVPMLILKPSQTSNKIYFHCCITFQICICSV